MQRIRVMRSSVARLLQSQIKHDMCQLVFLMHVKNVYMMAYVCLTLKAAVSCCSYNENRLPARHFFNRCYAIERPSHIFCRTLTHTSVPVIVAYVINGCRNPVYTDSS